MQGDKKSPKHQSLAEFICNNLKCNATVMNMRFQPVAKDTDHSSVMPSTTDSSQETNVQLDVFLSDSMAQPSKENDSHAKSA